VLRFLVEHDIEIAAVVTRPDKPQGRSLRVLPPPVKETAAALLPHTPIHQPVKASTTEFAQQLQGYRASLFVVVAYGEIVKKIILDLPPLKCLNVHASLLPKYRGASPIQRCLMHGDKETGVSIMDMVLEMDAGDVYEMVHTQIPEEMTFAELDLKLSELAGPALLQTIKNLEAGTAKKTPQDSSQATFAPKLSPEEEMIRWNRSAREIHNLVRALSPAPGAWCYVDIGGEKKRLKIKRTQLSPLAAAKNAWIIPCSEGFLQILEVQLEGKKTMPASDFLRGAATRPQLI